MRQRLFFFLRSFSLGKSHPSGPRTSERSGFFALEELATGVDVLGLEYVLDEEEGLFDE